MDGFPLQNVVVPTITKQNHFIGIMTSRESRATHIRLIFNINRFTLLSIKVVPPPKVLISRNTFYIRSSCENTYPCTRFMTFCSYIDRVSLSFRRCIYCFFHRKRFRTGGSGLYCYGLNSIIYYYFSTFQNNNIIRSGRDCPTYMSITNVSVTAHHFVRAVDIICLSLIPVEFSAPFFCTVSFNVVPINRCACITLTGRIDCYPCTCRSRCRSYINRFTVTIGCLVCCQLCLNLWRIPLNFIADLIVHINITGNTADTACKRILPDLIFFAVGTIIHINLSNPSVPVVKAAVGQIVIPPILIRIHTHGISGCFDLIAESRGDCCEITVLGSGIFQIVIHGIRELTSLQQSQHMVCFTGCLRCICRIGIQINAIGNPQSFTFRCVINEIFIILTRLVLTITAADNGKIDLPLYRFPVDLSLMLTDINTNFRVCRSRRRKCRCDIAEEQHRHCHKNKNKSDYFLHSFVPFSFIIVVSKAFSNEKCSHIYSICFQRMCQYNRHFAYKKNCGKPQFSLFCCFIFLQWV